MATIAVVSGGILTTEALKPLCNLRWLLGFCVHTRRLLGVGSAGWRYMWYIKQFAGGLPLMKY